MPHRIYDEGEFRQVLTIEQKRVVRSGSILLLIRLTLKDNTVVKGTIEPSTAIKMFAGLSCRIRDIDSVGWYRQGRVVGAILSDCTSPMGSDADKIVYRMKTDLQSRLPALTMARLQFQVSHFQPQARARML